VVVTEADAASVAGVDRRRAVFKHVVDYAQGWVAVGGHGLTEAVATMPLWPVAPDRMQIVSFTSAEVSHPKIDALERAGATEIAEILS
jgi:hypothetical protein